VRGEAVEPRYRGIVDHYEKCLARFGDTAQGVDWPSEVDAATRYRVMLDLIGPTPRERTELLDFGCGAAHLLEFMRNDPRYAAVEYSGADLSHDFVALSKRKFPTTTFYEVDVLREPDRLPQFDYVVLNGVLTERLDLSQEEMLTYAGDLLAQVFTKARRGIAFNVMSKQVDWERADLFHLSFDELANLLNRRLTRNFTFRHDYHLYEYTTYVYR
jgi:SAM-dependent methyltransferase